MVAFKTFASGLLPAGDVDLYLMQQAVIVCTASTRPASPVSGMRVWQTDTGTEHVYDGSAWQFLGGVNRFALKTANETVTSSTTLQSDDHLLVPVEANAVYSVEAFLVNSSPTAADLKLGWTVPSGATMEWSSLAPHTAQTNRDSSTISVNRLTQSGAADAAGYGDNVDAVFIPRGVLVVSSTAGTLQFQWAQATSNGTPARMKTGSYLYARRVA